MNFQKINKNVYGILHTMNKSCKGNQDPFQDFKSGDANEVFLNCLKKIFNPCPCLSLTRASNFNDTNLQCPLH